MSSDFPRPLHATGAAADEERKYVKVVGDKEVHDLWESSYSPDGLRHVYTALGLVKDPKSNMHYHCQVIDGREGEPCGPIKETALTDDKRHVAWAAPPARLIFPSG